MEDPLALGVSAGSGEEDVVVIGGSRKDGDCGATRDITGQRSDELFIARAFLRWRFP